MLLSCHYNSPVLQRNTRINVVIPTPALEGQPLAQELPVLYLLHGLHGDADSWVQFSNVVRYAEEAGIAVVMPSAGNSFYQDMVHGERVYTYMTKELPAYIQGIFPVSQKREDAYIAGLSMGGYGAWFLALRRPDLYCFAASFSGPMDIGFRINGLPKQMNAPTPFYVDTCFGDLTKIGGSDRDLFTLFAAAEKESLPRLYQSCGTADFLYMMNVGAHKKFTDMGAEITYREIAGMSHEWDFWDDEIRHVLRMIKKERAKN